MIEGNAPYLLLSDGTKLKNLDSLLGFSMPKQNGSAGSESINSSQTKALTAPQGMTFVDIKALVPADGNGYYLPSTIQCKDDDGDECMRPEMITVTWRDNENNRVTSHITQPLTVCGSPYTLTISVSNLKAQTKYGVPNSTDYGSLTKTYTFTTTAPGICYIRPGNMTVYTGRAGVDILYGRGYNPKVWDAGQGFSVTKMRAAVSFPTTGFHNAFFDLIGAGNDQSKYRCSKKGSWVELSGSASKNLGANCRVTYNHDKKTGNPTKPTTPITIDMEYKGNNGTWARIDSYTIPVPSKWAIGMGVLPYEMRRTGRFPALDACRSVGPHADSGTTSSSLAKGLSEAERAFRQKYLYRSNELTNSPYTNRDKYPEGIASSLGGRFSRTVGTFMGEWGYINFYKNSPFSYFSWYWTAEIYGYGKPLNVHTDGRIYFDENPDKNHDATICRGD